MSGLNWSDWMVKILSLSWTLAQRLLVSQKAFFWQTFTASYTHPAKSCMGPATRPSRFRVYSRECWTSKNKQTKQDIYVVKGLSKALLGLPAIEALHLITRLHTVQTKTEDFVAHYPAVFKGLGKLKEPYKIELEQGAIPYALSSPRRVPLPLWDKVKVELQRMESIGVTSKVTKPTPWCAGLVVVPKPQGKIRLCVDLTHLKVGALVEAHLTSSWSNASHVSGG